MPPRRPVDLRLLSYFRAAVEAGNITQAASNLHVAQPTLSKALRLLETQLGVRLLDRRPHGIVPTTIGERLLARARSITGLVDDALDEVETLRTGAAGRVRVGAGPSWVRRFLPDAVATLLERMPGIEVSVTTGFDMRLLEGLSDGTLDLVVAERPLSGEHAHLAYRYLTRDNLIVCARAGHPLAGPGNASTVDALAARWALPGELSLARRKLSARMALMGVGEPANVLTSTSISFLLGFAQKTDALVYTTRSMLLTPEAAGLVELDLPDFVTAREAGILTPAGSTLSPAAHALANHLAMVCAADPVN